MLLDRRQPVDPLVIGEGFVVIGNQARRLAAPEVQQSGMSQMTVNQRMKGPPSFARRATTKGSTIPISVIEATMRL